MRNVEAVIFDMDGVIVDSEAFWKQAELEIFSALGVTVTAENALLTSAMTTTEVAAFWHKINPWDDISNIEVCNKVIERVKSLVEENNCDIPNVDKFLHYLKSEHLLLGLATNSPHSIVRVVLRKMGIDKYFDVVTSVDFVKQGKPHPEIYLHTAKQLNLSPHKCIAIEDSYSGMTAARDAGMKVAAFTNKGRNEAANFADLIIEDFSNVQEIYQLFYSLP
ncbi:hexitol phosphatase HxpB [Polluticaenibacter yanchengensis]|uniref:Hexitol phosphatase HxpB n=1 Tax=Polluticaenibacter yanchengensis TaxID=3014562 RepID=A0ABT4UMB5_9BACT|nr:hexitol phosphatase HxpB [Chitinophagaceae bacterium LY-5]